VSGKGPDARLVGASIGVTLLVLAVGWFALVSPRRHESARLSHQIENVQEQLATARLALRPTRRAAIAAAAFFPLARAMPSDADMPDLLIQLSQIADQTGITFDSIAPQSPAPVGSYSKLPIELQLEGRFYDLADFLFRLRNLVGVHGGRLLVDGRLFSVGSVSFGQGTASFPQVQASLTVDAYTYDGAEPPFTPPAPPPPPAGASALGEVAGG
jgi:hypothetical protein